MTFIVSILKWGRGRRIDVPELVGRGSPVLEMVAAPGVPGDGVPAEVEAERVALVPDVNEIVSEVE
jgi:hypothetical protein